MALSSCPPLSRRFILLAALGGATLGGAALAGVAPGHAADTPAALPRIGIIGAGQVGGTLGRLWAGAGYSVMFSSRHPDELGQIVAAAGPNARAGTVEQAIAFGDVILLAVPYHAEPGIAHEHGAALAGKVLIDADNAYPFRDGAVAREAQAEGVARYSARLFAGTRFVRAFNSVNASSLADGGGGDTEVIYSYTDNAAGAIVAALIKATGSIPVRGHDL
ncbi:NAD(P)-binding domain-containing protein [Acetobacter sp. TBRC 12305]|uniref:NAD(P)-binding domain-containing protein n=1 Tax=Acetobacter garciniae TaxID=2817435 RepID=A0A939HP96_9PROT|nr:NAD(P)-binding domain-containing protein [Acetobacter garciniae]MBO1325428.1 NAD(P)-binding domain-containing protein [Acetobacter garciniae]MBX0345400.1 NAD(P)-binding domain-containing protein [Acetobacter garciniae]